MKYGYHVHMKSAKIAELRNRLSSFLRYVRRGGVVRVYDRDVPIADLVPTEAMAGARNDEELLAAMERRGVVQPPEEPGPFPKELLRPGPRCPGVVEALLEERREGR
jgi:antitoxin (DNA-binding transcriptional repressor) of toxin-antitoxin stability system